ncbi:SusC/RagA family TonB-linked outer membrane protein [Aureibaculum marinum]|uniref:SusC/RagA family TonB-linked outer membrane protein n=1 Tax=Aureibaculum marinum TaxID=2487930 RepID=A0A3N4P0L5_9FLAO|nr:SusC/RagA family TonB-linked outer membrane protein [Aureibaculum marinum]RPD99988.1 SusC/RagA family TonB-linked outer membrane protein [Aureibaculum marinum]
MKTKKTGFLILVAFFVIHVVFSQGRVISGKVSDEQGMAIPGVTITVKGSTKGVLTDFDGNYSVTVNTGETLVFSFLGMETIEKTVGTSNVINITMIESAQTLEEVVVTAMGIERAEKTLGYGVSTVKSDDFTVARETDVIQALQGKISGVEITGQGGGLGASSKITIRGMTRIGGSNNPLWVIDGVPISDANDYTTSRITGAIDYGNRAQDINPDDIETLTVLKGASAAALYGSRASNGVIMVTTKKGKGKSTISYSTTMRFDSPLKLPDFQNIYGPGNQGSYDEGVGDNLQDASSGWGPVISEGGTYTDYAGNLQTFTSNPDLQKDFYALGATKVHSLSISGVSNKGLNDYRISTSYSSQEGIIPGSSLEKLNLSFKSGAQLFNNLSSNFSMNYVNTGIEGAVAQGTNDPNVLTGIINRLPRTTDISVFTPWINESGDAQLAAVDFDGTNNPYWIINENQRTSDTERFFGNVSLNYEPVKNISMLGRVGYDTYNTTHFSNKHKGTIGLLDGSYTENHISRKELTLDFLTTYDNTFGDFDLTLRSGVQWNERDWSTIGNKGIGLTIPELFDPGNVESNVPWKNYSKRRILGVFGDFTLTYKKWLTLNATARNDWSSTLPKGGNSYFYPSIALSFIFTDAFEIDSNILSYGKIRGNWANVGSDTGAYQLDFLYSPQSSFYGQFNTTGTFPFDGQLAFSGPNTLPNVNLKPENQANYEIGLELGFFKNRLTLDGTFYKNVTTDQIISLLVPASTGYSRAMTNLGQISNTGLELELGALIIRHKGFRWNLDYNFSTNETIIDELGEGIDTYTLASAFNGLLVGASEGESIGLYGNRFARALDEQGNPIEDMILVNSNGLRYEGDNARLGNVFPDFTMGLTSSFRYKGWTLSTTFNWKEGGVLYSNTVSTLRTSGLAAETAIDRETLFVDPNTFVSNGDGTYSENTTPIPSVQEYWTNYSANRIHESSVFDATYIKWRELGLSYNFNKKQLQKLPFSSLRIGVQGRNLAIFNTSVPHIDPETNLFGSGSNGAGIEYNGVPSTRSIGFNIQVKF